MQAYGVLIWDLVNNRATYNKIIADVGSGGTASMYSYDVAISGMYIATPTQKGHAINKIYKTLS